MTTTPPRAARTERRVDPPLAQCAISHRHTTNKRTHRTASPLFVPSHLFRRLGIR